MNLAQHLRDQADHLDRLHARRLGLVEQQPSRPDLTAGVAWGLLLLTLGVREILAVHTRAVGDTLSETVWWMAGPRYGWRWVLTVTVCSSLGLWFLPHFGWRRSEFWLEVIALTLLAILTAVSLVMHITHRG